MSHIHLSPALSVDERRLTMRTLWPFRQDSMAKLRPAIPAPITSMEMPVSRSRSIFGVDAVLITDAEAGLRGWTLACETNYAF